MNKINMAISRERSYDILELPSEADATSIETNYKRLALYWHPDKHSNSAKATKRFQQISVAYKKLTQEDFDSEDELNMTQADMLVLFDEIFFQKQASCNGYSDSSDESDLEDDTDYISMFAEKLRTKQDFHKHKTDDNNTNCSRLTPEEIAKNADELLAEEEKEKKKAEKRRAKKKRRREQKKKEKAENDAKITSCNHKTKQNGMDKSTGKREKKSKGSSDSETEGLDTQSAFFTKVVSKKKKGCTEVQSEQPTPVHKQRTKNKSKEVAAEDLEELDPVVLQSRQLAIQGNQLANQGHYSEAADLFSEAIMLDGKDFRFYGNRSYCYDRLQQYEKALKDADRAIQLDNDWPKGYFRKGRALEGLKLYPDAEQAFMQVIKLDRNCEDALQELLRVRTQQLTEMGFSRAQAEAAIKQYNTVQQALDSLLAGVAESSLGTEVYVSDEEDYIKAGIATPPAVATPSTVNHTPPHNMHIATPRQQDQKMDPKNPEGLTALWVGNVLPEVKEKNLTQLFSKYGSVTSVRCLPEKYCAFVNFKTKESAAKAMAILQGHEVASQHLLIKFPDNPIENGNGAAPGSLILKKPTVSQSQSQAAQLAQQKLSKLEPKQTGPVNGDECYFWRTTGCAYGDKCHYQHKPTSKGVDKKPWQKIK